MLQQKPWPKILLLGAAGQLGRALRRTLPPLGVLRAYRRAEVDVTDFVRLRQILEQEQPDIIVNAAAYTAVDQAESAREAAFAANSAAVALLANYAAAFGVWLLHYSTDYVFSGEKFDSYREEDAAKPVNVYGESKYQGEQAVQQSQAKYLIIRTAWVYGLFGKNFLKTILKLAQSRTCLSVVCDQYGTPTSADFIAAATTQMLGQLLRHPNPEDLIGIYHLTAAGQTTWYDYARFVLAEASARGMNLTCQADTILPVATKDYPTAAPRPLYSCLNTQKIQTTFALHLPPWQEFVVPVIEELVAVPALLNAR